MNASVGVAAPGPEGREGLQVEKEQEEAEETVQRGSLVKTAPLDSM